jgi:hypothetical protein
MSSHESAALATNGRFSVRLVSPRCAAFHGGTADDVHLLACAIMAKLPKRLVTVAVEFGLQFH